MALSIFLSYLDFFTNLLSSFLVCLNIISSTDETTYRSSSPSFAELISSKSIGAGLGRSGSFGEGGRTFEDRKIS
jgi:hypothetical protein